MVDTSVVKLEESNCALLGSELQKKLREMAAEKEEAWQVAGKKPGLEIWRIEKFKVVPWPEEEYGNFYQGDTYIVFSTVWDAEGSHFDWNAHMWVGKETSIDEAGTAAYKIVELDDYFKREVTLYREVQDNESPLFLSYFTFINILKGGIESGFKKVPVEEYQPRLLHVRGRAQKIEISEVECKRSSLSNEDVYILDAGLTIYNWRGSQSNSFEKFAATSYCTELDNQRAGKPRIITLEEGDEKEQELFMKILPGDEEIKQFGLFVSTSDSTRKMFKLSDADGSLGIDEVDYKIENLHTSDAFIIDNGKEIVAWIGKEASGNEKRFSFAFAHKYISQFKRPFSTPVITINEGKKEAFIKSLFE